MRTLCVGFILAMSMAVAAQAPARSPQLGRRRGQTGTLAQVMRGIYFPNANLIFDVQQNDPSAPKKKSSRHRRTATDTYANAYTGWEVVENAAVALTDGVDLVLTRGRLCQERQARFRRSRLIFRSSLATCGPRARPVCRRPVPAVRRRCLTATNDLADACSSCHRCIGIRVPQTVRPGARRLSRSNLDLAEG